MSEYFAVLFCETALNIWITFSYLTLLHIFCKYRLFHIKRHMCSGFKSIPCLDPVRSLLGPVLGVYFVFLVAALCLVQSNSSVLSWVNIHILSSSKLQWNLSVQDTNGFNCEGIGLNAQRDHLQSYFSYFHYSEVISFVFLCKLCNAKIWTQSKM